MRVRRCMRYLRKEDFFRRSGWRIFTRMGHVWRDTPRTWVCLRSEEHTSELQSRLHLVCRLLLEKKKDTPQYIRLQTPDHMSSGAGDVRVGPRVAVLSAYPDDLI